MMGEWIALRIITYANEKGIESGKEKYRAYFIKTNKMNRYQGEVNSILTLKGYGNCIVSEEE